MADKTIAGLDPADPLDGTEKVHGDQGGNSRRFTTDEIAALSSTKGQHTIGIPAESMKPDEANGAELEAGETSTFKMMSDGLLFDAATSEGAQFKAFMPKSWDGGVLIAQFYWMHPATTTNFGVTWGIQARAFGNGDALDAAFGTAVEVSDTGGLTDSEYLSPETGGMTVGGSPGTEEMVIFRVYRDPTDGSDTMAVDAKLLGVKLHYTTNAETDS